MVQGINHQEKISLIKSLEDDMFKKKKKKSILFKKFEEDKRLEEKMEELKNLRTNNIEKEKIQEKEKKSVNKVSYLQTDLYTKITVAVTNINESVKGSQSVVLLLANYFAKLGKKVCVVTKNPIKNATFREFNVISSEELYESYEKYQVIIYEFGNYQDLNNDELNEMVRCLVKIMVTEYQIEMMEDMARFIMSRSDIKRWVFYFMYVPDREVRDVDALMEDYTYHIMPLFTPYVVEKNVEKILKATFRLYEVIGIGR